MKTMPLSARKRTEEGSRACRKLRRSGEVPAVLYGTSSGAEKKMINEKLAVSAYELTQLIDKHASVLEVFYEGQQALVQLSEVQHDALGDHIVHVDLKLIDPNKPMHGMVELIFKGDAIGLKSGGKLTIVEHSIEIEALPKDMPQEIVVRVDHLDLDGTLHVDELELPAGTKALTNGRQLVVSVLAPTAEGEEEGEAGEAGAGAVEPEVIAKGKKEEAE